MEGKADYKPTPGMEDRWHVIGSGERPIMILQKKEIPGLFDANFWQLFECWQSLHFGLGLPGGGTWDTQDPDLMHSLVAMEAHYRKHFSMLNVIRQYFEALIQRYDAVHFKKKARGKRK